MASRIKISSAVVKPWPRSFRQDEIAALYMELRAPLSASLRRWKLPSDEVEDIVHDTFLRLLSHGPADLKAENARYWLFRVAQNLAIDRQRSGWRNLLDAQVNFDLLMSARPSPHSNPEKVYLDDELLRAVQSNLAKLTPRQQHAIYLRIIGFSYKAIANQLKGTSSGVGELIRRGLKRLEEMG